MKFTASSPNFFDGLTDRFEKQLSEVHAINGKENISKCGPRSLFTDETLEPKEVVEVLNTTPVKNLLQKNTDHFEEDLWTVGNLLLTPEKYFTDGARALIETPQHSLVVEFSKRPDKPVLKEQATKFVEMIGSQSLSESADAIIEELYMNAVIDAPREAERLGIPLPENAANILQLECNETKLVISCADPFGALNIDKFIKRMNEVYARGAGDAINLRGQGGAGLGCVIMFEHSMAMYLGVQKNKCTRVTCVLPVGMSNRQRAKLKKSLHRLEIES